MSGLRLPKLLRLRRTNVFLPKLSHADPQYTFPQLGFGPLMLLRMDRS